MKGIDVLENALKNNRRAYELFLSVVIALEGAMLLYGFLTFDLTDARRVIYLILYGVLLIVSAMALIFLAFSNHKPSWNRRIAYLAAHYSVFLVLWSAGISACDIVGGGYPVTFMTLLAAVGSVIPFHPVFFLGLSLVSSGALIGLSAIVGHTVLSISFYINHFIFILVAVLVEMRMYRSTLNQYFLNARLQELAAKDGLTTLLNRRSLDNYVTQLTSQKTAFTFVLLDIDNFKKVNDTFGHRVGDDALVMVSSILTDSFGNDVFRYGGDEFAIVSTKTPEEVASILDGINSILKGKETRFLLQISAGIYWVESGTEEQRIFELADKALYAAKNEGKARHSIFAE